MGAWEDRHPQEIPEGLPPGVLALYILAQNAGYHMDPKQFEETEARRAARLAARREGREDRRAAIRQAAIDAGFLPQPEPEDSSTLPTE